MGFNFIYKRDKKAFTLIELMVVSIVVGILMALVMPVLGKAREGAKRTQCANNLREIGIALHLYIDDHNYRFPALQWWYIDLAPYIDDRNVFKCPSYKHHRYVNFTRFSYGYNDRGLTIFLGGMDWEGIDINEVLSVSQCIMVTAGARRPWADEPEESWWYTDTNVIVNATRHSGGTNILFVDGHVKWHLAADIPTGSDTDPDVQIWWNYSTRPTRDPDTPPTVPTGYGG